MFAQNEQKQQTKFNSINDNDNNSETIKLNKDFYNKIPLKFDAQEFFDIHEDDVVDFKTNEEFLLHFSRIGQVALVNKLIRLKNSNEIILNIDCKGTSKANFGWSPLHLATYFGHFEVVDILLKNNADVNIQNEEGDTPLHKAAHTGRENIVTQLLTYNANVFIQNGDGLRPINLAKTDSIAKLLSAAEQSDMKKREERFLSAARSGDLSVIKELLENTSNGVNINCVDSSGNTALHCAAYRGQYEVVIFLLKNLIDTTIKNNRGQLAANMASTISLKQIIQEAHLSIMTPKAIAALKNKSVSRFEGFLLKKGRFFGWQLIWAVLERGVFSYFHNRADATTGIRRIGYKYLENAITEVVNNNNINGNSAVNNSANNNSEQNQSSTFIIIFGDRSRALFSLPKNQTELNLQKWISSINNHIYFSTNFIKQGTYIEDSDEEDEAAKLLSSISIQDMILTSNAHQKILERHINSLQQLMDDEFLFPTEQNREDQISNDSFHTVDSISKSTIPSIKFHLNLIMESSKNANNSLTQCLSVISHQNKHRQNLVQQEQDRVRALEEALQLFAREHHDLERSIQNCNTTSMKDASFHLNSLAYNNISINQNSVRSLACLSTGSATDYDEFFDAFDDIEEANYLDISDQTIDVVDALRENQQEISLELSLHSPAIGQQSANNVQTETASKTGKSLTFFSANVDHDNTINESVSTLSPDDDEVDKTIASEDLSFIRENLPSPMVPRDEIGLWSILKHCIGKELSKITFPVIFNEPLSFLQRMTEILQYSHFLNIADQCDDVLERMENICAFIVSAYSSNWLRLNKPFNPLLGETFEYWIGSSQTRIICEQVSHHPPISAWHAESPHYILHGTSAPKLRFWGKFIEVKPDGFITLKLKRSGEVYTWKSVNCCVHNIIVGKLWFEQYGTIEVINQMNQFRINLNFKPAGWSGADLNRFEGFIQNAAKKKLRFVYGKWNDYLKSSSYEDYEEYLKANNNKFHIPDRPSDEPTVVGSTSRKVISKLKQLTNVSLDSGPNQSTEMPPSECSTTADDMPMPKSDSSHSLDISNSRVLWNVAPRPENSAQYYHFTSFTFGLNELPQDSDLLQKLPHTDSRFRPDIRKLEEGDLDAAALEKNRLEEKQRESRRLRKKGKMKEFEPLWFRLDTNQYTGMEDWIFTEEYWTKPDFTKCPNIF